MNRALALLLALVLSACGGGTADENDERITPTPDICGPERSRCQ